jgi:hypothetical protein
MSKELTPIIRYTLSSMCIYKAYFEFYSVFSSLFIIVILMIRRISDLDQILAGSGGLEARQLKDAERGLDTAGCLRDCREQGPL